MGMRDPEGFTGLSGAKVLANAQGTRVPTSVTPYAPFKLRLPKLKPFFGREGFYPFGPFIEPFMGPLRGKWFSYKVVVKERCRVRAAYAFVEN